MRLRPSIEAAGPVPDPEPRQPLPKTARSGGSRYDALERCTRNCENRTESFEPNTGSTNATACYTAATASR